MTLAPSHGVPTSPQVESRARVHDAPAQTPRVALQACQRFTIDAGSAVVARWALVVLSLSATIGVWFRLQVLGSVATGYVLENIRHAHSHLVLFGWALPAMFVAMSATVRPGAAMSRLQLVNAWAMMLLALISAPLFARWGYGAAQLGSARLPLSVMVSGVSMVAWYVWMAGYVRRGARATVADALGSWAVGFLLAASALAWSVAVAQARGATPEVVARITHAFLHLMVVGFLATGALALAIAPHVERLRVNPRWADAIAVGVLLSALADLPHVAMARVGRAGFVLLGLAGLALLARLVAHTRRCSLACGFGLARSGAELLLGLSGSRASGLLHEPSHRLLYLHVTLVGFVSIVLVERLFSPSSSRRLLTVCLALVAASLLPLSLLWPPSLRGAWAWWFATFAGASVALASAALATMSSERARQSGAFDHARPDDARRS